MIKLQINILEDWTSGHSSCFDHWWTDLPWGGRHVGAAFFRDHVLPNVTDVFDFARFSYDNVVAEDGHVVAVFNIGVTGTDAIIKIDHWTLRDGKAISLWAPYFEPQAVLQKLGIKLAVDGGMNA